MSTLKLYVAAASCKRSEKIPHVDFSQNLITLILTPFGLFGAKSPEQKLFLKKKESIWLSPNFSQKIKKFLHVDLEKNSGYTNWQTDKNKKGILWALHFVGAKSKVFTPESVSPNETCSTRKPK